MSKLWDKGYELNQYIEAFTVGNDHELDDELVYFDCVASKAHAETLNRAGYLSDEETGALKNTLDEIIERHADGAFKIKRSQEDCHTAIEEYLTEKLGDVGKKIHTGRSRNDQVLTALRLYYKLKIQDLFSLAEDFRQALEAFVKKYGDIEYPGYTHMQKAMPSSFGLWGQAFLDSMMDNEALLKSTFALMDQSPLGTGAGYGVPLELDRDFTARKLGFSRVQKNPIYAQHSRGKFEILLLQVLSMFTTDLNKMASDLILFNMEEFGFVNLPDEFCTGSSIMPQKKNPDLLELIRARHHVVKAAEFEIAGLTANLISGYNRDLQLSKEPSLRGIKATLDSMKIAVLLLHKLSVNEENCRQAMSQDLYATEQAYALVKEGVPFREAYRLVAKKLREAR